MGFAVSSFSHSSRYADLRSQARSRDERREARREARLVGRIDGEERRVPPERERPSADPLARELGADAVPVVDGIEGAEAPGATAGRVEQVLGRADPTGEGEG